MFCKNYASISNNINNKHVDKSICKIVNDFDEHTCISEIIK